MSAGIEEQLVTMQKAVLPEYKRLQRVTTQPRVLEPTLGHRMRRLNPSDRAEVQRWMRVLSLRKTIRTILAQARAQTWMQQSQASAPSPESNDSSQRSSMLKREQALAFFAQGQQS